MQITMEQRSIDLLYLILYFEVRQKEGQMAKDYWKGVKLSFTYLSKFLHHL